MIITGTPRPRELAVYRTAPWRTQTATGGDCWTADGGAKPDRSRNTADTYPVEIRGQMTSWSQKEMVRLTMFVATKTA